ncbi:UbiH/UbiF/VisC/COQ6 family ubiquinone biosynthesis hydroxylase [Acidisphaera sp. S103]|uniref:UbiH/UbiF/VisC/COQ6 family ubiquinone biosynthesis hydroxylase n=1 Tax=Acidisphaera sp. S103 TaxID=1747223 RepID=UPI0020B164C9|nr:UbiH/UbiF/VisC/COQ6 family ubiquinone biosynthesis hydroxylase [Acidisphaera sp. S103]
MSVQVCIMGAGPVGGTLACRLASAGVSVALIDQAVLPPMENPAFDGRAYAIAAGSRTLLEDAGLWDVLDVPPNPILDIRVSDGRIGRPPSRLHLHFDHREAGGDPRPFGWMVEARSLRKALNARFPAQAGLHLFAPAKAAVERSDDGALVRIEDGPVIACQLVVAAEGRNSPLREQAGIPVTRIPYGQTAIVCAVSHEYPHHGLALEHFLPAGPFAALPMGPSADAEPGGAPHVSAIVWTERTKDAAAFMALDDGRFAREAARRLGPHLGAIRAVGRRWSYNLSAMIAHRYADTRLALAGDAAHGIHPIAGQGLNLGFRDGIALADLIVEAVRNNADVGGKALLTQYQRMRQPDNLLMFAMTDGIDRLFSTDRRMVRAVRDLGINAVDRLGPMKRMFMRRAMGVTAPPGS